ncbi:MAG: phage protein Gp27 family protein [Novosphingobium sp.]
MGRSRTRGRGRLSSIDLLPEEAEPEIVWVAEELRQGRRLQIDILAEFNARLADRGIGPVSKSAFGRYSARKAEQFRELDEIRRISAELSASLGTGGSDDLTMAVAAMVKKAAYKILEGGLIDPKSVMELARAVQAAASATKMSAEHRRKLEEEFKTRFEKAVGSVEKEVHKASEPMKPAEVLRLIRKAYGVEEGDE